VKATEIIGYEIAVIVKRSKWGYTAQCPGVGGVYAEGKTKAEAVVNACRAAIAIMEARRITGSLLTEDSEYLKVITRPTKSIEEIQPSWKPPIESCSFLLPTRHDPVLAPA
jgi:predicted RNase H-like HicB family nuclease